jgi:hypothetical protein
MFKDFSYENEKDCDEVANIHSQLNEITQSDMPKYGAIYTYSLKYHMNWVLPNI